MLNTTDKISAKTKQTLIWNECTSKRLLLNSTTNVKMSYIGSGRGEDEIKRNPQNHSSHKTNEVC